MFNIKLAICPVMQKKVFNDKCLPPKIMLIFQHHTNVSSNYLLNMLQSHWPFHSLNMFPPQDLCTRWVLSLGELLPDPSRPAFSFLSVLKHWVFPDPSTEVTPVPQHAYCITVSVICMQSLFHSEQAGLSGSGTSYVSFIRIPQNSVDTLLFVLFVVKPSSALQAWAST